MRRGALVGGGLLLVALWFAAPAFAQFGPWTLEGMDQERAAKVAEQAMGWRKLPLPELGARCEELRAATEANPGDGLAYLLAMGCLQARALKQGQTKKAAVEAAGGGPDLLAIAEDGSSSLLPALERLLERWVAEVADDPTPHLLRANFKVKPEEREAALREVVRSFPDDLRAPSTLAFALLDRGQGGEAAEVLQRFVDAHPEDPAGFRALVDVATMQGNRVEARARIEAWLGTHPDDQLALRRLLEVSGRELPVDRLEEVVHRVLAEDTPPQEVRWVCRALAAQGLDEWAVTCFESQVDRAGEAPGGDWVASAVRGLAESLVRLGRWEQAREAMSANPDPEEALFLKLDHAARVASEGRCEGAAQLLAGVDVAALAKPRPGRALLTIRTRCGGGEETATTAADFVRSVDPAVFRDEVALLRDVVGQTEGEGILLERMGSGEITPALAYELLARLWSLDCSTRALGYLEAWADAEPTDPKPASWLASALEGAGAVDLAVEARREEVRRAPARLRLYVDLVDLLVRAGRLDEARTVAEGVLLDSARLGDGAAVGHQLLARVAVARGDEASALEELEALFTARVWVDDVAFDSALGLLHQLGRTGEIGPLIEQRYRREVEAAWVDVHGGRDASMASRYERAGLPEQALPFVERQVEASPGNARAHASKGTLLLRLGRFEEAEASLREAIRLDPRADVARRELVEMLLEQERYGDAAAVLELAVRGGRRSNDPLAQLLDRARQGAGQG